MHCAETPVWSFTSFWSANCFLPSWKDVGAVKTVRLEPPSGEENVLKSRQSCDVYVTRPAWLWHPGMAFVPHLLVQEDTFPGYTPSCWTVPKFGVGSKPTQCVCLPEQARGRSKPERGSVGGQRLLREHSLFASATVRFLKRRDGLTGSFSAVACCFPVPSTFSVMSIELFASQKTSVRARNKNLGLSSC